MNGLRLRLQRISENPKMYKFVIMAKMVHLTTLGIACLLSLTVYFLYHSEKSLTVDDFITYYSVIPAEAEFNSSLPMNFYSFSESREVAPEIKWVEHTVCEIDDGAINILGPSIIEDEDYFVGRDYPEDIINLLEFSTLNVGDGKFRNGIKPKMDQKLRNYASSPRGFDSWTIDHETPPSGSVCYTKHKVLVYTKFFSLEKTKEFTTGPYVVK